MEKIYLSDSGPKVSPAIYGFWRWDESGPVSEQALERTVNLCLELGINTFDHADFYGGYEVEELFGKVIRSGSVKREDLVLFTKCGRNFPHPSRPEIRVPHVDTSAAHIRKSVDDSLRKLRTEYIDIFLLEHLDPISNIEETAITLESLRNSGKVRNIGVSHFTVFQHQLLSSLLRVPIVTNHVELNVLNTSALDNGQLDYIKQRFMRPIAASPLAGGRVENGTDAQAVRVRAKLEEVGKKYGANAESTAVAWLVRLGALPLIGTQNENRIRNIAKAFEIDMDHQDWYDIYNTSKGS